MRKYLENRYAVVRATFNLLNPIPSNTNFLLLLLSKLPTRADKEGEEAVVVAHLVFWAVAIRAGMVVGEPGSTARRGCGLSV